MKKQICLLAASLMLALGTAPSQAQSSSDELMTAQMGAVGYTFMAVSTGEEWHGMLLGTAVGTLAGSMVGPTGDRFEVKDVTIAAAGAGGALVLHQAFKWLYRQYSGKETDGPVALGVTPQRGGAMASVAVNF